MKRLLFSARGRITRTTFWKGALLLIAGWVHVWIAFAGLTKVFPSTSPKGNFEVHGTAAIP